MSLEFHSTYINLQSKKKMIMSPNARNKQRFEAIFFEASNLLASDRSAYLNRACDGEPDLRAAVEELLEADVEEGSFLDKPIDMGETGCFEPEQSEGAIIGPYKLLQRIGEGGFGVVYMAEQSQPVRRKVALKIIKPGMDTKEVIARFEAERQALAMMDHPNIAKVLDAGTTSSGRPISPWNW